MNDIEKKYKKKCEDAIKKLDKELFKDIDVQEVDENGQPTTIKFAKNQIKPIITPARIDIKLNELLRNCKPMTLDEARELSEMEYLTALRYYLKLIDYICKYVTFIPSRQSYCAFVNITVATYVELLKNSSYADVFNSIEDALIGVNFTSSQAGLIDAKTTLDKLQMKDAGHNLVKNVDTPATNNYYNIDKRAIEIQMNNLDNIFKGLENKK